MMPPKLYDCGCCGALIWSDPCSGWENDAGGDNPHDCAETLKAQLKKANLQLSEARKLIASLDVRLSGAKPNTLAKDAQLMIEGYQQKHGTKDQTTKPIPEWSRIVTVSQPGQYLVTATPEAGIQSFSRIE